MRSTTDPHPVRWMRDVEVLLWTMSSGKRLRLGGEGRRSRNNFGAADGGEVGAAAVRHMMTWLNWLEYGRLGLGFNY